jgi:hypothetical protein
MAQTRLSSAKCGTITLRTLFPVLTLTLPMLTPGFAWAEQPQTTQTTMAAEPIPCSTTGDYCHDGFYLRVTTGFGHDTLVSVGDASASRSGGTWLATVAVAATPVRGFVVGGVLGAGISSAFDSTRLGSFIDWYPEARGGWHLGISAEAWLVVAPVAGQSAHGIGPGATLFAGYDWWIRRQWSLGLVASVSAGPVETMRDDRGVDSGLRFAPFEFGLGGSTLFH